MRHVYIAGPFFNQTQIRLVERVEHAMTRYGVPYFSPRLQDDNDNPETTEGLTPEKAARIFKADVVNLENASAVIAILDYALLPDQSLRIVTADRTSPPVSIPDSGTVWEMGYAYARGIPVYGLTFHPSNKMNLMLTQSCEGIIYGYVKLHMFLEAYPLTARFATQHAVAWRGDHR